MLNASLTRLLIIGGSGFVGKHLIELAASKNIEVFATKLPHEIIDAPCKQVLDLNILDMEAVTKLIGDIMPQAIIHLAAQSSVGVSWNNMDLTFDINVKGTAHVLNAVKAINPEIRLLLIGSSEEYGRIPSSGKVSEELAPNPMNPYAISKTTGTMLGKMFYNAFHLDVIMMRAFNHIGAGQRQGFVVPDFCKQIVAIENGEKPPILSVGNLSAARDFSDVNDIVRGYLLTIEKGKSGELYNIGSGKSVKIETLLQELLSHAKVAIEVVQDPAKMRPVETAIIEADISKLQKDTGYSPHISLKDSLLDVLEYERTHYTL